MGPSRPKHMSAPDGRSRAASLGRFRLGRGAGAVLLAITAALAGGITTTERTSTSMVADTRSQGPGSPTDLGGFLPIQEDEAELALAPYVDPALLDAVPVNEEAVSDEVAGVLESAEVVETLGESGIPEVAVEAYTNGADVEADADPACGLRWTLLAAIGRVESNHGRFGGAQLREDGYGTRPIRGIPLDGRPNVALIRDTENGELDGDTTYDRAVGPMQFIPSTWASVGQDGNDDGRRDPDNIFDAARGAGAYLCADGADLNTTAGRARAVRRYNNADEYVRVVLSLAQMYETGRVEALPDLPVGRGAAAPSGGFPFDPWPSPSPSGPSPSAPSPRPPTAAPSPSAPSPSAPSDRPPSPRPPTATPPPAQPAPAPAPPAPATPPPRERPSAPTPPATATPPAAPPTTSAPSEPAPPSEPVTPAPPTTLPADPTPTPPAPPEPAEPAPPATPPAAVGWAPAMREVVVEIISAAPACPPADAPVPTPAPAPAAGSDVVATAPPASSDPACPPATSTESP